MKIPSKNVESVVEHKPELRNLDFCVK